MLFAFGRLGVAERVTVFTFIFLSNDFCNLPIISDVLHPTLMDFVGLGNLAAFIPFDILIPYVITSQVHSILYIVLLVHSRD